MNLDNPEESLSRRHFLVAGSVVIAASGVARAGQAEKGRTAAGAPFALEPLPWKEDALAPIISANTISIHYGKHHKAYYDNLNKLVEGKPYASMTLEQVVEKSAKADADVGIFNNAAQAWNHRFYWESLAPNAPAPAGKLAEKIKADLGGLDECKKLFADAAKSQFGSGWAWLVLDGDKLKIVKTSNADNPLVRGQKPLLTIDVWEHAYYLDYQNRRPDHVQAVIDKLLNWEMAAKLLG